MRIFLKYGLLIFINFIIAAAIGFYIVEGPLITEKVKGSPEFPSDSQQITDYTPIEISPTEIEVSEEDVSGNSGYTSLSTSGIALNADTLDDLDSTDFIQTGTAINADLLDSIDAGSFVRSDASDSASGALTFTASPGGSSVSSGPVYINPSSISSSDYTLFGLAVGGSEKLRVDGNGNLFTPNRIGATKYCIGSSESDCVTTFANTSSYWTENTDDDYVYLTNELNTLGNSVADGDNKLSSLYLADGSALTFGTSNDTSALFSGGELQINLNSNNFSIDNDLLYFDSSSRRVGVDSTTPDALLDVEGVIATDSYAIRSTTDVLYGVAGAYDTNEFYINSFRLGASGATSASIQSGTTDSDLSITAGTLRSLILSGSTGSSGNSRSSVIVSGSMSNWSSTRSVLEIDGTWSGSGGSWNGLVKWFDITPTIDVSASGASAGYRAINVDVTETTLPSGQNYLLWLGTGGAGSNPLFTITNTGDVAIGASVPDTNMKLDVEGRVQVNLAGTQTSTALCGSHAGATGASVDDVEIVDCTGTPAADYMEIYPVEENTETGTVVAIGSSTLITKDGDEIQQLVKTSSEYQSNVLGVISDKSKAGDFNSIGYNINDQDNPLPIALSGRVYVSIASYSQSIAPGDYLTSSNEPGKAMKATAAGPVIGKALQAWAPDSQKERILMFVSNTYYPGQ